MGAGAAERDTALDDERSERQRSLQYFTSSHTDSHFLRQANGLPHVAHSLVGILDFLCMVAVCVSMLTDCCGRSA